MLLGSLRQTGRINSWHISSTPTGAIRSLRKQRQEILNQLLRNESLALRIQVNRVIEQFVSVSKWHRVVQEGYSLVLR
jgi:hypothetical protein